MAKRIQVAWMTIVVFGALGQAPDSSNLSAKVLAFDVASIRLHKPRPGEYSLQGFTRDGFRATNIWVKQIILTAYGIDDPAMTENSYSIPGAPSWVQSDPYDLQAKISDVNLAELDKLSQKEQLARKRLMLQSLLADRFQLKVHFVPKEVPCHALVLAKNGPKNMKEQPEDAKLKVSWSDWNHVQYGAMPLVGFMALLSGIEQCPVSDKTGLPGHYDFSLAFARDSSTPGRGAPDPSRQDTSLPPLFTALQEQLGLKLQPEKVQVQSLVIDHIERPSEN
jgi:uncharacterized protein (TIGR03435 family)